MMDQEWVARFNRDLDALVAGDEPESAATAPAEYQQMVALARTLAITDLSDASTIRRPLRRRLLTAAGPAAHRPAGWAAGAGPAPAPRLRPAVLALVAAGLLAWGATRAWPPGASGDLGAQARTASPTFAQASWPAPAWVSTPRGARMGGLTPVPAPTAGNSLSVAERAPAAGTRPVVVPSDSTTPAEARPATGVPHP